MFKRLSYRLGFLVGFISAVLKWSPWFPWTVAKLNMAWKHYVATPMYERRVSVDREFRINRPEGYSGNFPLEAFIDNREYVFFARKITRKEWMRIVFTPFSCGNTFKIPTWRIKSWFFGGAS